MRTTTVLAGCLLAIANTACFGQTSSSGRVCPASSEAALTELAAKEVVDCDILIQDSSLQSLGALGGLRSAPGIFIDDNTGLVDISSLASVERLPVVATTNTPLSDILVLPSAADGWISISNSQVRVLESATVGNDEFFMLFLQGNPQLEEVHLPDTVALNHLEITGSPMLESLDGIPSVRRVDTVVLRNNPNLPIEDINEFLAQLDSVRVVEHCGNDGDDACPSDPVVTPLTPGE